MGTVQKAVYSGRAPERYDEFMKALIKKCWDLYKKYEEGLNYLIFGFLAFVLNYALYFLFESVLQLNYLVATGLS